MRSILVAGGFSMLITLLGTRMAITIFARRGYAQIIRADGPTSHHTKRGTPTMGGAVLIIAVIVAYAAPHLIFWWPPTASALLVLFLFAGLGAVGFTDDFIKIFKQRSLGLRSKAKLGGQFGVAVVFAVLALQFPDETDITPLKLAPILFVIWACLIIASASNGVNLTDGLDGLATGAATMIFAAYLVMSIWQFTRSCKVLQGAQCYEVRDPYDLAVVSAALVGACFGFLWWNAAPARIFMGDTGALSLGGAIAGLAIMTRTELLLFILGGLLVLESLSVIIQVGNFKFWKWRTGQGRRIFRMAPIHHHFELRGWAQITVTIRFWIVCGLFVAAGLGIFYAEWLVAR
jgi:phospho-N-acetylmuramoyl-pentapeptide-transferase